MLKLSDFDFLLPRERIAQYPLNERDNAKLLVLERQTGRITHRFFRDIVEYVHKGDCLVLNDTKVLPARLCGARKTGGKVEVFLLKRKEALIFSALIKPSRIKVGEKIFFNDPDVSAVCSAKNEISFSAKNSDAVYRLGAMPLPPYIKRNAEALDNEFYQTVFACKEGAVAAPTAGLHFTKELIKKLQLAEVGISYLTLHVGLGTFKPVKLEDPTQHIMEKESFEIPQDTLQAVAQAHAQKQRVVAVGTTSLRALETYAITNAGSGYTDLFIYPGYTFKLVDCLLTNFHLPRTTLFMLVCAFASDAFIKKAYAEAISRQYRFYSYGDAMLII